MSTPLTVTSTLGSKPPSVSLTSPTSGTQRSVSMVGHAQALQLMFLLPIILDE